MAITFEPFANWDQLIDHVRAELPLWYHAPLDYQPVRIYDSIVRKDGKVRVYPSDRYHAKRNPNGCDPFTADRGHLERFRRIR